ncbi:MAG: hypothetical protein ACRCZS_19120 [Chroococcidiopsis sp.]
MVAFTALAGAVTIPATEGTLLSAEINALKAGLTATKTDLTAANGRIKILEDEPDPDLSPLEEKISDLDSALKAVDLTPYLKIVDLKTYDDTSLKARLKAVEDKPAFDPQSINNAIAELVANEKIDDKAAADLKAAFDALPTIDLAPYAKIQDVDDAIARLEQADSQRLVVVTKDHYPTDAEIDGTWGLWESQVRDGLNVKINFFLWIKSGNYAHKLFEEDSVLPLEAIAKYDPARQTYTIPIEGLLIEYNKIPIPVLEDRHFDPPALIYKFTDANTVFSGISWKSQNANGFELGNGGQAAITGESLTVIQNKPVIPSGESPVIARVIFEFTKLDGSKLPYEVKF